MPPRKKEKKNSSPPPQEKAATNAGKKERRRKKQTGPLFDRSHLPASKALGAWLLATAPGSCRPRMHTPSLFVVFVCLFLLNCHVLVMFVHYILSLVCSCCVFFQITDTSSGPPYTACMHTPHTHTHTHTVQLKMLAPAEHNLQVVCKLKQY